MISRPGFWKTKEGSEIALTAMEASHVRHVCRFLRNKVKDAGPHTNYKRDCAEKLIELGNEAQRRGLIPAGDITVDQLNTIVDGWQAEWDRRRDTRPARVASATNARREPISSIAPVEYISATVFQSILDFGNTETKKQEKPKAVPNNNERFEADLDDRRLDIDL